MLDVRLSTRFKKDYKLCVKRGLNVELLQTAVSTLRIPQTLPQRNLDHVLSGNYAGYRECHLQPDWLLVYRVVGNELQLTRTGTHADIFDK